jgi:hypothetical protein
VGPGALVAGELGVVGTVGTPGGGGELVGPLLGLAAAGTTGVVGTEVVGVDELAVVGSWPASSLAQAHTRAAMQLVRTSLKITMERLPQHAHRSHHLAPAEGDDVVLPSGRSTS